MQKLSNGVIVRFHVPIMILEQVLEAVPGAKATTTTDGNVVLDLFVDTDDNHNLFNMIVVAATMQKHWDLDTLKVVGEIPAAAY